jgi:cellulose synthase/poly-beta-1,6-N-acetylglucosamine synthase-like glycosyltransferase
VIDDRSEDSTGAIFDRLSEEFGPRLRVLYIRELPSGWLGKTHAMWRGGSVATGKWLLFTDADVVHTPQSLWLAVACAERNHAAHMVLLPTMHTHTVGERMMISFFQAMFLFQHRPWKAADPRSRDYLGVGAFNLVRRDAYEAIGTYESMRLSVVDDMRLAEKLKQSGWRSCIAFGPGMVTLRWAVGARGVVQNLIKNFFAHLHYSIAFALFAVCGMLWLHLGPWLGLCFATGWARAGYGLAMGVLAATYVGMGRRTGIRASYLLLHPVATVLMAYTVLLSTVLTLSRGGVVWRGTFYPLNELKRNF